MRRKKQESDPDRRRAKASKRGEGALTAKFNQPAPHLIVQYNTSVFFFTPHYLAALSTPFFDKATTKTTLQINRAWKLAARP
jgi:hypothetical protein